MQGLYFNKKGELIRLIRFYGSGLVLGTSIASSNLESSGEDISWFSDENYDTKWGKGNYIIKRQSDSSFLEDYFTINFELSSENGGFYFTGNIINSEKIDLTFDSEFLVSTQDEKYEQTTFKRFHSKSENQRNLNLYQGYLGLIIKYSPERIMNEFCQQYIIENGRGKLDKVAEIIKNSEKVKDYLYHLKFTSTKPNPTDLQYVINSHSYFRWAMEETVCLGSLSVILNWSSPYDDYEKEEDEIVNKLMATVIDYSSKAKYNQFNSFFQRFYRRLRLILETNELQ